MQIKPITWPVLLVVALMPIHRAAAQNPDADANAAAGASAQVAPAANPAEPIDPRTKKPIYKIFIRSEARGGRFIQLGEGGETLPVAELPNILSLSKDEEVQKEMQNYQFWKKMNLASTGFTIGAGAGAFILWGSAVSNNESGSGAAMGAFVAAGLGIGLMYWTQSKSDQAVYRAQQIHNGKLKDSKSAAFVPSSLKIVPGQGRGLPLAFGLGWTF